MALEYLTIQIAVAILTTIAGVFTYTIGRYYYKDQSIQNLNDFLKTLDIDLVIEKLQFNSKFWKTAAVSMITSIIIVALIYAELIVQVVPDENILVTAFKFFAIGIGMNFTINSLASGGKLSSIIQSILSAILSNDTTTPQARTRAIKTALESNNIVCREGNSQQNTNNIIPNPEAKETSTLTDKPKE